MKKVFSNMWDDIKKGKKIDAYGTIFTLIIVVALSFIDVLSQKQAVLLGVSAIIMILISLLLIRKKADETIEIIQKKRSLFTKAPQSYDQYNEHIKTSRDMFFWGVTLGRLSAHLFELRNQSGRPFRAKFLIIKQGGIAAEMECIRSSDDELNIHDVDQSLQKTIRNIRNYLDKNSQPDSIEIRAIDYLPPWSIMAFNPLSEDGVMYVSLMTFKTEAEKRPSFMLHASDDSFWMKNFTEQFNAAWEVAEKINVSKLN